MRLLIVFVRPTRVISRIRGFINDTVGVSIICLVVSEYRLYYLCCIIKDQSITIGDYSQIFML